MEVGDGEGTWDQHAVQGTCSNLEKKYFRLTGPPDPQAVRPPSVLQAALDRVVRVYRAGQCDMHYAEDQLKAMRQDVTVQHVRGALPVRIYEAHARACLEHGNGGDFNQCQAQLTVLYEEGSPGCVQEFVAYRVLYQSIFRSKESASLLATLEQLSPQVGQHAWEPCPVSLVSPSCQLLPDVLVCQVSPLSAHSSYIAFAGLVCVNMSKGWSKRLPCHSSVHLRTSVPV